GDSRQAPTAKIRSSFSPSFLSARECISTQTAQPLICEARRLVNSIAFRGTPPSSTDFEIVRRTSIAEGRIIAGFFILAFILLSSINVSGSLRLCPGPARPPRRAALVRGSSQERLIRSAIDIHSGVLQLQKRP